MKFFQCLICRGEAGNSTLSWGRIKYRKFHILEGVHVQFLAAWVLSFTGLVTAFLDSEIEGGQRQPLTLGLISTFCFSSFCLLLSISRELASLLTGSPVAEVFLGAQVQSWRAMGIATCETVPTRSTWTRLGSLPVLYVVKAVRCMLVSREPRLRI